MTTRNVLIVDDEPKVAFFLSKALERSNLDYCVSVAHSGEEALEMLDQSPVDLLVTDLRMPGISGLELIRWVRASSPQTRTILITAYGNDEVEAETRRLEAYRYITKPFDIGDFTQVVQDALSDVAVSRPGLVVLSGESFEAIAQQLERLRYDIGARCILLADMQGQRLVEVGDVSSLDTSTLLSLLAGGFAASVELARQFGGGEAVNFNFHEGVHYEIYSANVGDDLFLAIIYDRRMQTSRIGLVWLYTQRTIEQLLTVHLTVEAAAPVESLDADFGSSLKAELDMVLTEEPDLDSPLLGVGPTPPGRPALNDGEKAEDGRFEEKGAERELLDMETAIARGLIPSNFGAAPEQT
ncbi:MAG: response regulator [Chloroflexota bacterium]|nr:response regulator [Chloroflexota bacterium]